MSNNLSLFLGEMLRHPTEVSALMPSSEAVAWKMTEGVSRTTGPVVEIGPGTGSFTRALLARGVLPENLTLMEMNARFCEILREEFPGVRVLNRPAQEIGEIGLDQVGAVISGVPVLARPKIQRDVIGPAFRVLKPDGFFTQITYSTSAPITAETRRDLGLSVDKRGTVWANLPPARVFVFRRMPH